MLKVGHVVVRPGRKAGMDPVEIPVPEELETVPGIPMVSKDIDQTSFNHHMTIKGITTGYDN